MKKELIKLVAVTLSLPTIYPSPLNVYAQDLTSRMNTTNNIAIMIEFSDLDKTSLDSETVLYNADLLMNDDGSATEEIATTYGNMPIVSLKSLIRKYSYGTEDVQTEFFPQDGNGKVISYTAPHPRTYYMSGTADGYTNNTEMLERRKELLNGALEFAKASIESTYLASELDTDNNGIVDAITFFVEGDAYLSDQSKISWRDLLWSHKGEIGFTTKLNGKNVYTYNMINTYDPTGIGGVFSLNRSGYGTILHEYMHVLGLPDLYRASADGNPVGQYDLMGNVVTAAPQGLLTYHLSDELGWHTSLPVITNSQRITLTKPEYVDSQETIAVKIQSATNKNEVFVAEYYNSEQYKGAKDTSDQDGLLLYRVKTDEYQGNINGYVGGSSDQIYIFSPNEVSLNAGQGTLKEAVLRYGTTRASLGKDLSETKGYDNQALFFSNGENSGIKVSIVSQDDKTITFDVTVPTVQGTGTQSDPYLISTRADLDLLKSDLANSKTYYKLTSDIDLQGETISSFSALYGEFDGNGHTIKNLTVSGGGFYEQIATGAVMKNITFDNIIVTYDGKGYAGTVAGSTYGTLENVHVTSRSVTGNNARNSGGLTGTIGDIGVISNSSTAADVLSSSGGNGGLVGLYQGQGFDTDGGMIKDVFVSGQVVTGSTASGAVIASQYNGYKEGQIQNVYYDKNAVKIENAKGDGDVSGIYYASLTSVDTPFSQQGTILLDNYFKTSGNIVPSYLVQNTNIATINNNQLVIQNVGNTSYKASLTIGTHTYSLSAGVSITGVNPSENFVTEQNFPDPIFREALLNGKTSMTKSEVEAITKLDISKKSISDLTGIQHLTELETLDASLNHLTKLDLSQNKKLTWLDAGNNQAMTEAILPASLRYLNLFDNSITTIDLTKMSELYYLEMTANSLSDIDLSGNPKLTHLFLQDNHLTKIDLSHQVVLDPYFFTIYGNLLTEIVTPILQNDVAASTFYKQNHSTDRARIWKQNNVEIKENDQVNFDGSTLMMELTNDYQVVFHLNNGENLTISQDFELGTAKRLQKNNFARTGYTFLGWAYQKDATTPDFVDEEVMNLTDYPKYGQIDLYAVWKANTYSVQFHSNNGANETTLQQGIPYGTSVTLDTNPFVNEGKYFVGWAITENGPVMYKNNAEIKDLAEVDGAVIDLYAIWLVNSYNVTFDTNGGSMESASKVTVKYNQQVPEPLQPTRTGYTFKGWINKATQTPFDFTQGIKEDIRLQATWEKNVYTIKFDGNDGLGAMNDISTAYDENVTLPTNTYVRDGYVFKGWSTSPDGNVIYTDANTIKNLVSDNNGEITLYAIWQPVINDNENTGNNQVDDGSKDENPGVIETPLPGDGNEEDKEDIIVDDKEDPTIEKDPENNESTNEDVILPDNSHINEGVSNPDNSVTIPENDSQNNEVMNSKEEISLSNDTNTEIENVSFTQNSDDSNQESSVVQTGDSTHVLSYVVGLFLSFMMMGWLSRRLFSKK